MTKTQRCAIYTRKSSEDGLEQDFNSLHAQREACAAYITSQKGEGWVLLPNHYDDGGISGGTLLRPALKQLLEDVDAGKVDQIIVYKVDRLTRSLTDFAKLVERLDRAGASFVSVTQSFNTATSMGRLTLNVLLSFAQFEREVTAERIRDKIAASKKKGLWMGGHVPLGYQADGRSLKVRRDEARTVRTLYQLYLEQGTVRAVTDTASQLGLTSRRRISKSGAVTGGHPLGRGHIHYILSNPVYVGRIRHKGKVYKGKHLGVIEPHVWNEVQTRLQQQAGRRRGQKSDQGSGRVSVTTASPLPGKTATLSSSPLMGKLYDETGDRLSPSHANKKGVRYRYYISRRLITQQADRHQDGWRLPAPQLEKMVTGILTSTLIDPKIISALVPDATASETLQLHQQLQTLVKGPTEYGGGGGYGTIDPTEQGLLNQLAELIARIDVAPGQLSLSLDGNALASVLGVDVIRIDEKALVMEVPFRMRKRGVETRLIFDNATSDIDQALVRNLAKAHVWLDAIKAGQSFNEIALQQNTSPRRIQQMMDLAFLAPDIARNIIDGKQPHGLTSDWIEGHSLPADWDEQRQLMARL